MSETSNLPSTAQVFADVEIGIGTWAWGDRIFWGYGSGYDDQDLREVFEFCCRNGFNFFDTAEVYGQGVPNDCLESSWQTQTCLFA